MLKRFEYDGSNSWSTAPTRNSLRDNNKYKYDKNKNKNKNNSIFRNKNRNTNRNTNTNKICKYCKSEEHSIDNCPIIVCKRCNEKGHVDWKCKKKQKSYTRKKRTKIIDNTTKMEYIEEHSSTISPTSVIITTENTIINNNENITIQNKKILSKLRNSNLQINILNDSQELPWRQSPTQIQYKSNMDKNMNTNINDVNSDVIPKIKQKQKPLIDLTKYINSSVIWSEL
jgi:hypothetical protein